MAKKLYEESNIASIAAKIREKTGTETKYKTAEMPTGVEAVYDAGKQPFLDIVQRNTTEATAELDKIAEYAFRACFSLTKVDFSGVKEINNQAFSYCYSLTTVILRSETVCRLANVLAFQNCYHFYGTVDSTYNPNGEKDGYIYVPKALVDSYKSDTNWSTFASQFRAIEDYPEICGEVS